ncbi:uncharacterized protein LOC143626146 isoform X2 [Bidens hawaiensis]|uniref:uncharacterized protein LOC143626146 isoform X2 n=1 Tax=Bidens hawaiensis TaxID=980011 RepID=UPI00404B821C
MLQIPPLSSSSPSINLLSFECEWTMLLQGLNASQIMTEDVNCWKLAAQYIQRELKDADELNLLDEEDMDVFGLRPMMDPLILVSCKNCKKPVKVSQYANHAGKKKKPPRKEKRKLQISISTRVASVGKPEKCETANTAASNSYVDEQTIKETSFPTKPKGKELLSESQARNLKCFDGVNSHQTPTKHNDHHLQTNGTVYVPAPLATKIFYSQRTQRLRSAIRDMYYSSSSTDHDHELINMQFSEIDDHCEKDGH